LREDEQENLEAEHDKNHSDRMADEEGGYDYQIKAVHFKGVSEKSLVGYFNKN